MAEEAHLLIPEIGADDDRNAEDRHRTAANQERRPLGG
jgi:hypothetical protein